MGFLHSDAGMDSTDPALPIAQRSASVAGDFFQEVIPVMGFARMKLKKLL